MPDSPLPALAAGSAAGCFPASVSACACACLHGHGFHAAHLVTSMKEKQAQTSLYAAHAVCYSKKFWQSYN